MGPIEDSMLINRFKHAVSLKQKLLTGTTIGILNNLLWYDSMLYLITNGAKRHLTTKFREPNWSLGLTDEPIDVKIQGLREHNTACPLDEERHFDAHPI